VAAVGTLRALRRHRGAILAVLGALVLASCAPVAGQNDEYLGGKTLGPYVGQVVDAETRAPIEGAVVVATWRRDRVWPGASISEHYAAREVLTDREGRFVLDATQLEEYAPGGTLRPTFTVFLPGYAAFSPLMGLTGIAFSKGGFLTGDFSPPGALIGLPRIKAHEERRQHLLSVSPATLSDAPLREIPSFVRLVNRERAALGLEPINPRE